MGKHLNEKIIECCEWCVENKKDGTWKRFWLGSGKPDVCCCYAYNNRTQMPPLKGA